MILPPIAQAIMCPLPGLEMVEVVYNVMATEAQMDALYRKPNAENAEGVIVEVKSWPLDGDGPWSENAPLAFRFWAARQGFAQAMAAWLNNPDFTTA